MKHVEIGRLGKAVLRDRMGEFQAVDADQDWMKWDESAYLLELPGKWDLSLVAETVDGIVGYSLCSSKGEVAWLHRMVVDPAYRSERVGARLLSAFEHAAAEHGHQRASLKTPIENTRANRFYLRHGYARTSKDGGYAVYEKTLTQQIVGIHQPNYMPWLGYYYKLSRSDVFVLLDDVLAPSRGYFNRSKVLINGSSKWLTVPVHRGDGYINQMNTVDDKWAKKHLSTLQHSYQKTRHFKEFFPGFQQIINDGAHSSLSALNEALIRHTAMLLGIDTPMIRSSEYELETTSDDRLVDLVKAVGGSAYLSGRGGDNYQNQSTFADAGLDLVYTGFVPAPYTQTGTDMFVPGLSAVDAIFNIGPDSARQLIDAAPALSAERVD